MPRSPEERREYQRLWARAWRAKNPKKARKRAREEQRKRKEKNPDRVRAEKRTWSKSNYHRDLDKSRKKGRDKIRKWRAENPEKARAAARRNHHANKKKRNEANRRYLLMRLYGLTPEDRVEMFRRQGSKCAACRSSDPNHKTGWHIDHDHKTGRVRGILCHGCNTALGLLRESPEIIRALAAYLDQANALTGPEADEIALSNDRSSIAAVVADDTCVSNSESVKNRTAFSFKAAPLPN